MEPAPFAPRESVGASVDGLAARSESESVSIGARPGVRDRTMIAIGFLGPILVGVAAYGFFAQWFSGPSAVVAAAPALSAPSIGVVAPSAAPAMAPWIPSVAPSAALVMGLASSQPTTLAEARQSALS